MDQSRERIESSVAPGVGSSRLAGAAAGSRGGSPVVSVRWAALRQLSSAKGSSGEYSPGTRSTRWLLGFTLNTGGAEVLARASFGTWNSQVIISPVLFITLTARIPTSSPPASVVEVGTPMALTSISRSFRWVITSGFGVWARASGMPMAKPQAASSGLVMITSVSRVLLRRARWPRVRSGRHRLVAECLALLARFRLSGVPQVPGIKGLAAGGCGAACVEFEALWLGLDQVAELLETIQAGVEGGTELADVRAQQAELDPVVLVVGDVAEHLGDEVHRHLLRLDRRGLVRRSGVFLGFLGCRLGNRFVAVARRLLRCLGCVGAQDFGIDELVAGGDEG